MTVRIHAPQDEIASFCERWQVATLALFGSVLRDDFGPESDIDVPIEFEKDARHSLFDMVGMEEALKRIFGREVDLVSRRGIERNQNYLRRKAILGSAEIIHESRRDMPS